MSSKPFVDLIYLGRFFKVSRDGATRAARGKARKQMCKKIVVGYEIHTHGNGVDGCFNLFKRIVPIEQFL